MSKSLGNIIDPIEIIDEFGADALRFSIVAITAAGQDVFLAKEKFELGRNFANKIWNASRFVLMNIHEKSVTLSDTVCRQRRHTVSDSGQELSIADKWILSRLNRAIDAITKALRDYRFNEAESLIYDFFWHDFCDWYLEMVKPELTMRTTNDERRTTDTVLISALEDSLKLLHPFMPFVTEAIWQNIEGRKGIMAADWPKPDRHFIDKDIETNMEITKDIIINIRNIRSDMNIPYSKKITVNLVPLKGTGEGILIGAVDYIKNLAQLQELNINKDYKKPKACLSAITEDFNIFIPLEAVIDVGLEKARLIKKQDSLKQQIVFTKKRLEDKNFIDNAPEHVVGQEQEKVEKLKEQIDRLGKTIKDL
jgi:valyl-tRNA synthetase